MWNLSLTLHNLCKTTSLSWIIIWERTYFFRAAFQWLFLRPSWRISESRAWHPAKRKRQIWTCGRLFFPQLWSQSRRQIKSKCPAVLQIKTAQNIRKYLCVSFSDWVKPDRSNHFIILHLFKHMAVAFCGDTMETRNFPFYCYGAPHLLEAHQ